MINNISNYFHVYLRRREAKFCDVCKFQQSAQLDQKHRKQWCQPSR